LRTNCIVKYCPFDTKTLIDLFIDKNKNDYLGDIENKKDDVWETLFRTDKKIFKNKTYLFDYMISTDCYGVSIQFINKKYAEQEKTKKVNMKNKRVEIKKACKDMTKNEAALYRDEIKSKKKNNNEKIKIEKKKIRDEEKAKFKKMPKEEQKKLLEESKKNRIEKQIKEKNQKEFPRLEELTDTQYENLKEQKWVVVDEGMRNIMYMRSADGKVFRYSRGMHTNRIKRFKYQRIIKNHKDRLNITEEENKLNKYNSKSCNIKEFEKYIKNKNKINGELFEAYEDEKFRQYKFYSHIQKQKAEAKIVRDVEEQYGKDVVLIMGDWSKGTEKIKHTSVPTKRIRKVLAKKHTIYEVDEFRTSCLHNKTEERCENLYLADKRGIERKIHSILTYKAENRRMECINRDNNATRNMEKIVKQYLKDKTRPEKYRRDYKLQ